MSPQISKGQKSVIYEYSTSLRRLHCVRTLIKVFYLQYCNLAHEILHVITRTHRKDLSLLWVLIVCSHVISYLEGTIWAS